jgi:uncharacterized protein
MKPEAEPGTLLRFPCDFPVKVMGLRTEGFAQAVVDVVLRHAPEFRPETVEMRASASGNYLSVTCTLRAQSWEQLDGLYRELSGHPAVKIVL